MLKEPAHLGARSTHNGESSMKITSLAIVLEFIRMTMMTFVTVVAVAACTTYEPAPAPPPSPRSAQEVAEAVLARL